MPDRSLARNIVLRRRRARSRSRNSASRERLGGVRGRRHRRVGRRSNADPYRHQSSRAHRRAEQRRALVDVAIESFERPKIIYVSGTIDGMSMTTTIRSTCDDYYRDGYTLEAFLAAFDPTLPAGRVVRSGPLEAARLASRCAAGSRADSPRLEHHHRGPRQERHDPRRVARHSWYGEHTEQPHEHHHSQPYVPGYLRLLPAMGAE